MKTVEYNNQCSRNQDMNGTTKESHHKKSKTKYLSGNTSEV